MINVPDSKQTLTEGSGDRGLVVHPFGVAADILACLEAILPVSFRTTILAGVDGWRVPARDFIGYGDHGFVYADKKDDTVTKVCYAYSSPECRDADSTEIVYFGEIMLLNGLRRIWDEEKQIGFYPFVEPRGLADLEPDQDTSRAGFCKPIHPYGIKMQRGGASLLDIWRRDCYDRDGWNFASSAEADAHVSTTLSRLRCVVSAISHMHRHGLCHNDLKLQNILTVVDEDSMPLRSGQVLVCDFGAASMPCADDWEKFREKAGFARCDIPLGDIDGILEPYISFKAAKECRPEATELMIDQFSLGDLTCELLGFIIAQSFGLSSLAGSSCSYASEGHLMLFEEKPAEVGNNEASLACGQTIIRDDMIDYIGGLFRENPWIAKASRPSTKEDRLRGPLAKFVRTCYLMEEQLPTVAYCETALDELIALATAD